MFSICSVTFFLPLFFATVDFTEPYQNPPLYRDESYGTSIQTVYSHVCHENMSISFIGMKSGTIKIIKDDGTPNLCNGKNSSTSIIDTNKDGVVLIPSSCIEGDRDRNVNRSVIVRVWDSNYNETYTTTPPTTPTPATTTTPTTTTPTTTTTTPTTTTTTPTTTTTTPTTTTPTTTTPTPTTPTPATTTTPTTTTTTPTTTTPTTTTPTPTTPTPATTTTPTTTTPTTTTPMTTTPMTTTKVTPTGGGKRRRRKRASTIKGGRNNFHQYKLVCNPIPPGGLQENVIHHLHESDVKIIPSLQNEIAPVDMFFTKEEKYSPDNQVISNIFVGEPFFLILRYRSAASHYNIVPNNCTAYEGDHTKTNTSLTFWDITKVSNSCIVGEARDLTEGFVYKSPSQVSATMYGFRFAGSQYVTINCIVDVCRSDSSTCNNTVFTNKQCFHDTYPEHLGRKKRSIFDFRVQKIDVQQTFKVYDTLYPVQINRGVGVIHSIIHVVTMFLLASGLTTL